VEDVVPGTRLTSQERLRLEVLWTQGASIPRIAVVLGRSRSTVWRELARNNSHRHGPKNPRGARGDRPGWGGLYRWGYHAERAQERARLRALRPRPVKLRRGTALRTLVLNKLRQRWSPQQIAGWLRRHYPEQPEYQVSHETIYQALYLQGRGHLRAELARQVALRSGRTRRHRRAQAAGAVRSARPWTVDLHISGRPAQATDRAVPGHWEGDLLVGAGNRSAIVTLVERTTRYVLLGALPDGRVSESVVGVLSELITRLPQHLRGSLTWDCGTELAQHTRFTVATGCPVYFCDPHSPWQRGTNENTNRLLRQYYPKRTNFRDINQTDLDTVAAELNGRPRETLNWETPAEALDKLLVATAA